MARLRNSYTLEEISDAIAAAIDADPQVSKDNMLKGRIKDATIGDRTADLRFDIRGSDLLSEDVSAVEVTKITLASKGEAFSLSGFSVNGADAVSAIESGNFNEFAELVLGGNDNISGGAGAQSLSGFGGNDVIKGKGGADEIFGGDGNDLVVAGGGADTVDGGAGADRLKGGGGSDEISGGEDNDNIKGQGGADILNGDGGNDRIFGQGGADIISGGEGDDFIKGQGGADILSGGTGLDTLIGGGGADTFMFGDEADGDEIRGFNGERDVIDFSESSTIADFADLTIMDGDNGAEISSATGLIAVLNGVEAVTVEESDFIFA